MSGTKQTRHDFFFSSLIVATALLAATPVAGAQTCGGKLPTPDARPAAPGGEKFRLINQQCPALAEPITVQRAPQLDLYERGSITINMSEPAYDETPAPAPALKTAPQPSGIVADRDVARVMKIAPAVTSAALAYNIDPLLLHAIAHVESRHRADAVSPAGARGVMQVMPALGRHYGVENEAALFDADTNLRASAAFIRTLRMRYGDDLRLVLAAYNAGETAVEKNGRNVPPYPETQAYVRDVLAVYRRLSATFEVSPSGVLVSRNEQRGDK